MNARRLFRSRTDRALAGIAGGMAEYLEVDPTVVRILWVLAAIFSGGLAVLLYIVLAFVIPANPYLPGAAPASAWGPSAPAGNGWGTGAPAGGPGAPGPSYATGYASGAAPAGVPAWNAGWNAEYERSRGVRVERPGRTGLIIGTVLIVFGAIALVDLVVPGWLSGALVVPGLLVALGVGLLVASLRGSRDGAVPAAGAATSVAFTPAEPPPGAVATDPAATPAPDAGPLADASPNAGPESAGYDDDATTGLPPQPGTDRA
ncbi:MAG TPA: PspC domain-containing protein [Candidatus Limnocylindrales bacterium]|nr:PspC domain-containing protein [Candidatus Limnocylindrales bacterium]